MIGLPKNTATSNAINMMSGSISTSAIVATLNINQPFKLVVGLFCGNHGEVSRE